MSGGSYARVHHPPYDAYDPNIVLIGSTSIDGINWCLADPNATEPYLARTFFTGHGATSELDSPNRCRPTGQTVELWRRQREAQKDKGQLQEDQVDYVAVAERSYRSKKGPSDPGFAPLNVRHDETWFSDLYDLDKSNRSNDKAASSSCIMCNTPNCGLCDKCKSAHYCSTECQRLDWPLHKLLCKSFVEMGLPPSDTKVRALHFDVDEPEPVVAFCEAGFRGEEWRGVSRDYMQALSTLYARSVRITRNPIRGRTLDLGNGTASLLIMRGDSVEAMPENAALGLAAEMAQIQPVMSKWRGSFSVLRELTTGGVGHATMRDFRDAMDYLGWYRPNPVIEQKLMFNVPFPVSLPFGVDLPAHGVKIACNDGGTTEVVQQALIPERHPMRLEAGIPSTIFEKLGIPVLLWKTGRYQVGKQSNTNKDISLTNDSAAALCLDLDPNSITWAETPEKDFKDAGIVLAVRADGAPLQPLMVQDVIKFSQELLQPRMKLAKDGADDGGASSGKRQDCLDQISWKMMPGIVREQIAKEEGEEQSQ